jgi:hypothetical protein
MLGASGPAVGEAFSGERLNEITAHHWFFDPGPSGDWTGTVRIGLSCLSSLRAGATRFQATGAVTHTSVYKGVRLDCGFRADLIVEDAVIVEIKAVDLVAPIH